MDKINYNQHDWSKGEVIKEENLDNMENGIKQATDKINEIIDTEQDFRDRMTNIDERININNEELVIARDGCDNLGQRIERDQQYIYNILNDGSYLEFNGTDITVDNSKEGYTSNMLIKGQTYQNLYVDNQKAENYQFNVSDLAVIKSFGDNGISNINMFKVGQTYTFVFFVDVKQLSSSENAIFYTELEVKVQDKNPSYIQNYIGLNTEGLIIKKMLYTVENGIQSINPQISGRSISGTLSTHLIILEGDWTNKEVPLSITGIESVGEKENNKISILSYNKNLFDINNFSIYRNSQTVNGMSFKNNNDGTITINGTATGTITEMNSTNLLPYLKNGKKYVCLQTGTGIQVDYIDGNTTYGNFTCDKSKISLVRAYVQITKGLTYNNEITKPYIGEELDEPIKIEQHKDDKKEILLPIEGGLKSLPNGTCDTIEQREDGVYLVQRIGKKILNGSELWVESTTMSDNVIRFYFMSNDKKTNGYILSDKFRTAITRKEYDSDNECCYSDGNFAIGILKSKLSNLNTDGFKTWLQTNPVTVYYELATSIETKLDIDTINLQVFKDKTYILSENNIKPEIVCKAPVYVNQTIADLQEEQEQLTETHNTLKEENEAVKTAISELNEQEDVQTADMLDLDMRVLALEEGLE